MAKELGLEAGVEAQHIMQDEHLSVGGVAGSDADGRRRNSLGHFGSQRSRNLLQHDAKTARLVQQFGVLEKFVGLGILLGSQAVSSELIHRLRCQAQVSADRDSRLDHMTDSRQHFLAALQFDSICSTLFQNPHGIAHRLFLADLITAEGHIHNDQRVLGCAYNSLGQEDHLVHGDRQRILVAAHHVAGTVTNQKYIHSCLVKQFGEGEIIRRKHGYFLARLFHLTHLGGGHSCCLCMY